jgi:serine/threonine protein kinase
MALSRPPEPKTVGDYELLQEVGIGSMGTVYRAMHRDTKDIVAIKIVHAEVTRNPTYMKRFEQEFRVASRLEHPNIVRAFEYNGTPPSPYLVMEFIDGESLGERLDRVKRLPEEEAVSVIVQVARGLHFAHEHGLIHRDVKPDNVMVTNDGKAKLADLGLVKDTDTMAELTRPGSGLGTPSFMAPEQFKNAKNASIRCDIYSLGASLYQMVTGVIPFEGCDVVQTMMRKLKNDLTPARIVMRSISERTDAAIRRAMDVDANKRPATCLEFIEDLVGPEGKATVPAPPAQKPPQPIEAPKPAPVLVQAAVQPPPTPVPTAAPVPVAPPVERRPRIAAETPPGDKPSTFDWPAVAFLIALAVVAVIVAKYFLGY